MAAKQEYVDKTWTDFTKRMKGSQVTPENWTVFYEKYYGFIVCYYCPDLEQEESCDAAECARCECFNDYLVEEFEGYLSFYQNVKIEKAMYGEYY